LAQRVENHDRHRDYVAAAKPLKPLAQRTLQLFVQKVVEVAGTADLGALDPVARQNTFHFDRAVRSVKLLVLIRSRAHCFGFVDEALGGDRRA
jgi:hypothetical protein